ncbi:sulfotransferase domain-containing protein [Paractinoplanes rishiriensis]|uniref:sulfotransferase domain-containing protein n=1 Tax=Paractinoplanes rishiriensis TaxID=1050105 RepID=UPI001EF1A7E6|nr:sulfotransferase domain-containing protein [Actinoplanes rishiriensis]
MISTRRRGGTTWMQMICALLIFQHPEPPIPLWHLSPWLDHTIAPAHLVHARLAEQPHRRFIKTHTPLDGIPYDARVSYIVVARHPLDVFVSLRHQLNNIDGARMSRITGGTLPDEPAGPVRDALLRWIEGEAGPYPETLAGVLGHLAVGWDRRELPNVLLVHYDDLVADLDGQMRGLAGRLGIAVPEAAWPVLTRAASFEQMRGAADRLVPGARGMFRDIASFFRRGTSGAGRELLTAAELAHYHARAAELAPTDLLEWLHGK